MWIKQENASYNSYAFSILKVGWILSCRDDEWGFLDLFNQGYGMSAIVVQHRSL